MKGRRAVSVREQLDFCIRKRRLSQMYIADYEWQIWVIPQFFMFKVLLASVYIYKGRDIL